MKKLLPSHWRTLRLQVAQTGFVLSPAIFKRIQKLFLQEYAVDDGSRLLALTREYNHPEYLLVVDAAGQPVLPDAGMLKAFADSAREAPLFQRWFRLEAIAEGPHQGKPVLLAARWLCHLSGLRHVTVEMFLDPPAWPGVTLVQVRGVNKMESPAGFDLPCAGHVDGQDGIAASMWKELEEELGLCAEDLEEMHEVCRFDAPADSGPEPRNHEYRVLYQARLKAASVNRIRLREGEVAGLAVISLPELRVLIERFPERVASGLVEAMPFYTS